MKILHLTLKKKWFDLIASGEKRDEYREFKTYWIKRLLDKNGFPKHFDIVRFKNGYGDVPAMDVQCKYIYFSPFGYLKPKHGEILTGDMLVIKLGKVLSITLGSTRARGDSGF